MSNFNHTGPGYWKITNTQYGFAVDGDKIRRKKNYYGTEATRSKPWLALWVTDNPYATKAPGRFKTHKAALVYALLGGTPIPPEALAILEER